MNVIALFLPWSYSLLEKVIISGLLSLADPLEHLVLEEVQALALLVVGKAAFAAVAVNRRPCLHRKLAYLLDVDRLVPLGNDGNLLWDRHLYSLHYYERKKCVPKNCKTSVNTDIH